LRSADPQEAHRALALELLQRHDGAERVPALPYARLITIAPTAREDDPVHVAIDWGSGAIEQPFPGASLWRAVLERRLAEPPHEDPADRVLRAQIQHSVERFPDLETWWHWLRTGWTAPPEPEAERKGRRAERRGAWWWPW
jgi:hypothetical protein